MGALTTTNVLPEPIRRLLDQHFASDVELPVLPNTALEVMNLCNEDNADARALTELLQRDQALAGHVLRVSNSAAYAPKEPIVSLQQAVSRLGIQTIKEIVLAISINGRVFRVPGWQVRIRELWMHSAGASVYAKEVARMLRVNVESAFMCGLLHDIGRPIVLQGIIDVAKAKTDQAVPKALAEAAMNECHPRIGAMMIDRWKLPDWLREATLFHHAPDQAQEYPDEVRLTVLADKLATWALDDYTALADFPRDLPVLAELNIYEDDLEQLLAQREKVIHIAEAFS